MIGQDGFNEKHLSYKGVLGLSSLLAWPHHCHQSMFYVESEGDISRILQGIKNAFNELAVTVNMKEGRIITLGDVEVDESTAFLPVHLGHGCSRLIRNLLQKYVPETLAEEGYSPLVKLFEGCSGGPLVKMRARVMSMNIQFTAPHITVFDSFIFSW